MTITLRWDDRDKDGVVAKVGLEIGGRVIRSRSMAQRIQVRPGETVLDLGSGAGIDCFLAAQKVGPTGRVYAVDISRNFVLNILRTSREQGLVNVDGVTRTLFLSEGALAV